MSVLNIALVITILVLAGALVWALRRSSGRTHSVAAPAATDDGASQAQVMHTTKMASLGQMVAGVAHEINTPLGFVRSNVEVIEELIAEHRNAQANRDKALRVLASRNASAINRDKAQRYLVASLKRDEQDDSLSTADQLTQDVVEGVDQIATLIGNLTSFARLDRDGRDLVDLNEGVNAALNISKHLWKDHIEIATYLADDLPKVKCIGSQINQVFLNLITNAIQAMPDGGRLTVTSRKLANDRVEFTFDDTGHGIPEHVVAKIFDPFFTTKDVGEGTGLGLSICHKIVEAHDGKLEVQSTSRNGTTFALMLPISGGAK